MCVYTTAQYIHVCAHVHVYTTVHYVHTCVYRCLHDTNTVTVRHPARTCMYNMPIQLYSKYTYTDVYRTPTLSLRETHLGSAFKECMCSHVYIQMYSTHLQIHVDVYRNLCKHQFRLHDTHQIPACKECTCMCTCICPCVCIQLYGTNTRLQTHTGHSCLSL